MRVRRGGQPIDLGPVDARDWFMVETTARCPRGHDLELVGTYGREGDRNPRCAQCQREAMARYRTRVRQ